MFLKTPVVDDVDAGRKLTKKSPRNRSFRVPLGIFFFLTKI